MLAAFLAGCGPVEMGLQRNAARQLQARVLGVSEAAAANDPARVLTSLDALEADLETSARNGDVSEERHRKISTIIAAIRADLTTVIEAEAAAQAAAAKAAEDTAAAAAVADAEASKAAAESQAAAEPQNPAPVIPAPAPVAPEPAPAPVPAPADNGKGNQGKAKGKNG
ncbi:hypothetical protein [Pseudarthrobacter sp. B4EP4b]|uniref:hypothetical protein n=1 Tax=Pseudarthrobacter sp. B4EP4b TaxID=2590664 RepID=UPI0021067869|nr:hypothetical protein [Pseudarthrobacter sp. B4EP4b]